MQNSQQFIKIKIESGELIEAEKMDRNCLYVSPSISESSITSVMFALSTSYEIKHSSANDRSITQVSELKSPFLGLPLKSGNCESCGAAEHADREGRFGFIKLPTLIFHPLHISHLKDMLSLLCLKCLNLNNATNDDISIAMLRKFLKKVDVIKRPRSGPANFKSLQIESEELQVVVSQYMFILRGNNGSQKRPWHGGSSVFKAMDGEDEDSIS
ncbi:DNA-directed RNA polymerase [Zostera marina]|uniref:DNA-directed RNA polymerase n=1 Tax=Zostera marina TaxID=29655 RepID=A0A0K9NS88_ZOSMR|nr:DNA-directed RNA polymerase [Zostera marina]